MIRYTPLNVSHSLLCPSKPISEPLELVGKVLVLCSGRITGHTETSIMAELISVLPTNALNESEPNQRLLPGLADDAAGRWKSKWLICSREESKLPMNSADRSFERPLDLSGARPLLRCSR